MTATALPYAPREVVEEKGLIDIGLVKAHIIVGFMFAIIGMLMGVFYSLR